MVLPACGGPLFFIPGGSLNGEIVNEPITDWSFVTARFVELETRPTDPYSVVVEYIVKDRMLYIDPAGLSIEGGFGWKSRATRRIFRKPLHLSTRSARQQLEEVLRRWALLANWIQIQLSSAAGAVHRESLLLVPDTARGGRVSDSHAPCSCPGIVLSLGRRRRSRLWRGTRRWLARGRTRCLAR
jgi:hypothetical protein